MFAKYSPVTVNYEYVTVNTCFLDAVDQDLFWRENNWVLNNAK
jgi:hypothetical protein